jgi:hypothetical protein
MRKYVDEEDAKADRKAALAAQKAEEQAVSLTSSDLKQISVMFEQVKSHRADAI